MIDINRAWKIRFLPGGEPIWSNSALLGLKKSGALVGLSYSDVVYIPHKYNVQTECVDIFEADFMQRQLDQRIKPPFNLREHPDFKQYFL